MGLLSSLDRHIISSVLALRAVAASASASARAVHYKQPRRSVQAGCLGVSTTSCAGPASRLSPQSSCYATTLSARSTRGSAWQPTISRLATCSSASRRTAAPCSNASSRVMRAQQSWGSRYRGGSGGLGGTARAVAWGCTVGMRLPSFSCRPTLCFCNSALFTEDTQLQT